MDKYPRRILIGLLAGLGASMALAATLSTSLLGVTISALIGMSYGLNKYLLKENFRESN